MRIAITADLHWGHGPKGEDATRQLAGKVADLHPDVFVIAGDVGTGRHFAACLARFSEVECCRLVLPGNHDLWTDAPAPASLALYERGLRDLAEQHGFLYLDAAPYVSPNGREAVAGSINWYDYSFADPAVEEAYPNARELYAAKLFPGARHNDGRFVHLGLTDDAFTGLVVRRFEEQLEGLPATVERIVAVQHHPPLPELFFPNTLNSPEQKFWLAYTGNRRMQTAVLADPRITVVVCGHTHRAVTTVVEGRACYNIGGDYDWKRLLLIDTETGAMEDWSFGE